MAIEKRPFGRTGHDSSAVIFGAAALWSCDQGTADRVLDLLFEHGVNHIDTAPRYGDSELRIGSWMREHRKRFFLATRTGERDYPSARDEIRRSLGRVRYLSTACLPRLSRRRWFEAVQAISGGGNGSPS